MNPLKGLQEYGQSIWLDYIRRSLVLSGELQRLVEEDGLRGVTSNPAIFEKAIEGSTDYTDALAALERQQVMDPQSIYERLAIADIQDAAAVMQPVYQETKRQDGYVSLEVSPYLAHDTQGTVEEARRLWRAIGRENVMIKVPATPEGIPAIEQLIGEGININVTLLFSQQVYERVAEAYLAGLETLAARAGDVSRVASVASFFVSRIDTVLDAMVAARRKTASTAVERALLDHLPGKVAIANAKLAYQGYQEIYRSERWHALAARGARPQRLLWASTGTKNPQYRDVIYLEELIGPDTVNTVPPATLDAFRDHGHPRASLEEGLEEAHVILETLERVGLCTEVLKRTFGILDGFPELHVLDSTDPAQIRAFEGKIDLASTLFIVSSKSGSTLEPDLFKQYFFERVRQVVGASAAGDRFIAITDPGSKLQHVAEADGFRHIFFGLPGIGGRYSALSDFGLVPAAIIGLDVAQFLERAEVMVHACASCVPPQDNPGVRLGAVLGALAHHGRNKVTLIASPGLQSLGAWLEQLLAESTGKEGKGIIPIDRERVGPPEVYGSDRVFVYLRLESAPDATQDLGVEALERAGQPVVRIAIADAYDLGQEFFRWEIATAVAGSILGIHPFNQPDVEASKVATRKLTAEFERTGSLPPERPILETGGIQLFTDEKNAASLAQAAGRDRSLVGYLRAHVSRLDPGDYFAILAYLAMNEPHQEPLQAIRHAVRDEKRVATCLGFGPRFLHSTGQAYKGGPNTGVFLQITCDDAADLPVPGQRYTFGMVKAAQARGDFQVLAQRNRRALRVHLSADVQADLATLRKAMEQALA